MTLRAQIKPAYVLVFLIGLGSMVGVLNTYHRFPSTADIYPNLVAVMFSAFGLLYWYMTSIIRQLSFSVLAWLLMFMVVALQPFINSIVYLDGMIFDLSIFLVCVAISLCLANTKLEYRERLYEILVYFLVSTAVLTVITQLVQYFELDWSQSIIYPNFSGTRISGNLSQPNQAAFTLSLGVVGLLYFLINKQRLAIRVLLNLLIVLLALGLGMTASRTGVVLVIVVLASYSLLFHLPIRNKVTVGGTASLLLIGGYLAGSQLLKGYNSVAQSSVERISDGSLNLRWYQLQQAITMFNDNKLTGVGWGNLLGSSIDYAQQLTWFSSTAHTHFFVSQIAVETGIIGLLALLPFVYILLKNFSFKLTNYQAAIYTMLAVFIAYSCSEFPLWLSKYLIVFVVLLSLIDSRRYDLSHGLKSLMRGSMVVFSMLLMVGSIYYQFQYRSYSKAYYAITESTFRPEEKIARMTALNPVFGFEKFDDLFLFFLMSEDKVGVDYKTELADKVLSQSVSYYIMTKSANIYLLADNKEKSLTLIKAACLFDNAQFCPELSQQLDQNAGIGGEDLKWVNKHFQKWRKNNPDKTQYSGVAKP